MFEYHDLVLDVDINTCKFSVATVQLTDVINMTAEEQLDYIKDALAHIDDVYFDEDFEGNIICRHTAEHKQIIVDRQKMLALANMWSLELHSLEDIQDYCG